MRFAPSPEQLAFARSLGELLADSNTPSLVRAWAHGDTAPGRKLWARLADQGVLALGMPEDHGGFGATPVDLVLAFEQLGRAAVPGPYVESVAVLPQLLAGTPDAGRLDAIGSGEVVATLAVPPHVPLAVDAPASDAVYLLDGSMLSSATVSSPVRSVDRARLLAEVSARDVVGEAEPSAAFERGVLATAAQLLGLGGALLERATAYAKQRRQFGTVIGSFQAVKHQLADVAVALELARPLLFGAALAIDQPTVARDVSAAKVACSDAAYGAARAALQVHGAIGYTSEYDLSLWLTKVRALTSAWGTQRFHRNRVLQA
ncbi:MAG TPA: acyl-CoA dehydrogenase family protein, partial [Jatrophihabitans sp.]|nr:acyl-CoA dehydrogenase family protein [Jatrophihabitans sp.]